MHCHHALSVLTLVVTKQGSCPQSANLAARSAKYFDLKETRLQLAQNNIKLYLDHNQPAGNQLLISDQN